MNIKKIGPMVMAAAAIGLGIYAFQARPGYLVTYIKEASVDNQIVDAMYTAGFDMPASPDGKANVYYPRYRPADEQTALYYSGIFDIREDFEETEDYYHYTTGDESLVIFKHTNRISYSKDVAIDPEAQPETDDLTVILQALEFIDKNLLVINYEELLVEFEEGVFYLTFVNRLGNLKNFGFASNMRLDPQGNVISLDYYYISYERLNSFGTKSMLEAYYELPIDFAKDTEVLLKDCQLVYVYENSIVQPAYLFQGQLNDGRYFESFVNAVVYE